MFKTAEKTDNTTFFIRHNSFKRIIKYFIQGVNKVYKQKLPQNNADTT